MDGWTTVFGHRRLAILDLSSAGHQPMRNPRNGDCVTYNGEVFNFHSVRKQLEQDGIAFHTESDTEVLLAGLQKKGLRAIHDWRGMFALAWFDAEHKRTVFIRDRLGIKPIYYHFDGETFVFASELRALLASGLVPQRLSRVAVESFLAYGSIEQPLTILAGVYAVLPGHTLTFEKGQLRSEPYWELLPQSAEPLQPESELKEEIAHLPSRSCSITARFGRAGGRFSQRWYRLQRRRLTAEASERRGNRFVFSLLHGTGVQ
jgi:asparagine synthase (glutamine-hydrolysing)